MSSKQLNKSLFPSQPEVIFKPSEWLRGTVEKYQDNGSSVQIWFLFWLKSRETDRMPSLLSSSRMWVAPRRGVWEGGRLQNAAAAPEQVTASVTCFSIAITRSAGLIRLTSVTWKWRCNSFHVGLGSFPRFSGYCPLSLAAAPRVLCPAAHPSCCSRSLAFPLSRWSPLIFLGRAHVTVLRRPFLTVVPWSYPGAHRAQNPRASWDPLVAVDALCGLSFCEAAPCLSHGGPSRYVAEWISTSASLGETFVLSVWSARMLVCRDCDHCDSVSGWEMPCHT